MGLFCINSGKVKVYKITSDGKEQILNLAKAGDFIGYRALISEEFYSASATVIEEGAICYIPKADFLEILNNNPRFFYFNSPYNLLKLYQSYKCFNLYEEN